MKIDDLIAQCDDPTAVISYPFREIFKSQGESVLGINALSLSASKDRSIKGRTQIVRRPGLGDRIFALAATYKYIQDNPDAIVTFSGMDNDSWMKQCITWCHIGVDENCDTIVNLDNTPCNGGDRTRLMGNILNVEVDTIEFPIKVPKLKTPPKPYFVLFTMSNKNGPRSLPYSITEEIMATSTVPLVFTDVNRYNIKTNKHTANLSGIGMLETIALIANSEGIIGVDSGLIWLASAMGKPALCFFAHVPARDRVMTCQNVVSVEPYANCAKNCGDHCGTSPKCSFRRGQFICMDYPTDYIMYRITEFERMVS